MTTAPHTAPFRRLSAAGAVVTHGDPAILARPALGLLCSVQCPGSVILKLYDAIRALRDAGVPVIGGFHSPMERECLDLLLRGTQPVTIVTPRPRTIVPAAWRPPLDAGRVLVLAPADVPARRTTATEAAARNQLVANLGAALLIAHASPGGKVERLAREALLHPASVLTLDDPANAALAAAGARPLATDELVAAIQSALA